MKDSQPMLYIEDCGKDTEIVQLDGNEVYLRVDLDAEENAHKFSYSTDGIYYREVGIQFEMIWGSWKGPRIGIYSYSPVDDAGIAYFDDFIYELHNSGISVN